MEKYSRASKWALGYLGVILLFAVFYLCLPKEQWGGNEKINDFGDALYFSVVTITSLGFGDIYPVSGTLSRLLVAAEVVLGILIIGFFLNDIAMRQAKHLDTVNKKKEEERWYHDAVTRLRQYKNVLTPAIERYLREIWEVVTPMDARFKNYQQDILSYDFDFEFRDLCDLYTDSILMSNGFKEPAISAYFKNQDALYEELRIFASTTDLNYWPDLETALFKFITLHQQIQCKDVILGNINMYLGSGENREKFTDSISRDIKAHSGELKFRSGNAMTPYELLFVALKENINAIKEIYRLMKEKCEE